MAVEVAGWMVGGIKLLLVAVCVLILRAAGDEDDSRSDGGNAQHVGCCGAKGRKAIHLSERIAVEVLDSRQVLAAPKDKGVAGEKLSVVR